MRVRRQSAERALRILGAQRRWEPENQPADRIVDFGSQNQLLGTVVSALVGTVEDFVVETGLELVGSQPSHLFTWPKRISFYRTKFQVELESDVSIWSEFNGFVQARNSFVHGGGSLSPSQQEWNEDRSVSSALAAAGLWLDQGVVRLASGDVERCWGSCRSMVVEIDSLVKLPS